MSTGDGMSESEWWVYVIRSDDNQLYTGITTDLNRRWQEHSTGKGGARYFRGRKPQTFCLLESHPNRSSASKREAAIKKLRRSAKEMLLAQAAHATAKHTKEHLALKALDDKRS